MRPRILTVLVAATLLLTGLAGCSDPKPPPEFGVVIERDHDEAKPAKAKTCKRVNGKRKCTGGKAAEAEEWDLTVRGRNADGDTVEHEFDVSEDEYDEAAEGECVEVSTHDVVEASRCEGSR